MREEAAWLDSAFLHRLDKLSITSKKMIQGSLMGKRKSKQIGTSNEFSDYRSYTPGDDLRHLDWNAYARIGKLFLKTFLDEQQWPISIYIDCSRSMNYGDPSKFQRALQLTAALGYITLSHFDRLSVYAFDREIVSALPATAGKGKVHALFRFLQSVDIGSEGDLNSALKARSSQVSQAGISIIISDFLFEKGYEEGIRFLQATKQEVTLIQLLSREERNPFYQGDIQFIDSETKQVKDVTVTPPLLKSYLGAVKDYQDQLRAFARSRGISYLEVHAEESLEDIVFQLFKKSGLIR